ncbi:MAG: EamA family transporter [Nannocystis sp.]|nr:EamA family transporter [Nannocystis sp.]
MPLLIVATLLWALSFGLIKQQLAGLDPNLVAWARLALALPLLLPFLRWRELSLWPGRPWRQALWLVLIGAVQYGLMYTGYLASFRYAAAHQVALFTVTTPLYVLPRARRVGASLRPAQPAPRGAGGGRGGGVAAAGVGRRGRRGWASRSCRRRACASPSVRSRTARCGGGRRPCATTRCSRGCTSAGCWCAR